MSRRCRALGAVAGTADGEASVGFLSGSVCRRRRRRCNWPAAVSPGRRRHHVCVVTYNTAVYLTAYTYYSRTRENDTATILRTANAPPQTPGGWMVAGGGINRRSFFNGRFLPATGRRPGYAGYARVLDTRNRRRLRQKVETERTRTRVYLAAVWCGVVCVFHCLRRVRNEKYPVFGLLDRVLYVRARACVVCVCVCERIRRWRGEMGLSAVRMKGGQQQQQVRNTGRKKKKRPTGPHPVRVFSSVSSSLSYAHPSALNDASSNWSTHVVIIIITIIVTTIITRAVPPYRRKRT